MARVRSPNYPALSLPAALDRVRTLQGLEGKNAVPREVIAKHLGFGGLNGASATVLSALAKYGLLEAVGDGEAKVSELALTILFPHDPNEKQEAIEKAAFRPVLFAKLREKWPDRAPTEESLRSYLVREGFSSSAAEQVIQFYRETLEIAVPKQTAHDSSSATPTHEEKMTPAQAPAAPTPQVTSLPPAAHGRPFTIAFDGMVLSGTISIRSSRDIDRLMKVLAAQKGAFEAMEDDDDWDTVSSPAQPESAQSERLANRIRLENNEDDEGTGKNKGAFD
ncbi:MULTISPECIES: hypothetical protein [unclassified Mesorhizobium]|uniref:hypothetical protein n=1 Tax=unclassified Mesorhizobium TaxID=325217 RepID=UPI0003CE0735|nr:MULTISPECIES: hypothetical protein [unclassified Mesorhizobium]ESY84713.1 hypothetical protein X741_33895 [Mesorhizobium sp. LNHC229A00]